MRQSAYRAHKISPLRYKETKIIHDMDNDSLCLICLYVLYSVTSIVFLFFIVSNRKQFSFT